MDLLELTRSVKQSGPVCDSCLGRLVADRSFGLTNAQRGNALRITLALADDHPYEPPASESLEEPDHSVCWVCEGECARVEQFAERALDVLSAVEFDTYQVGTRVPPLLEENDRLLRDDVGLAEDAGEPLKRELNREVGKRIGERTGTEVDLERPDVVVLLDLSTDEIEPQVNSEFVYGRYRKLERDIPQTRWPCSDCGTTGLRRGAPCEACDGTGYRYGTSVEQESAPILCEAMEGEEAIFHGAGREDVDALMLGDGRPFVIEIKSPRKRSVDLSELESEINEQAGGSIEVEGLRTTSHEMVERVKEHDASKTYRMAVEFEEPVDASALDEALALLSGATIEQRTPQRVTHRRGDIERIREVYDAHGELEDSRHAQITVHGEGGLYVKELISGDREEQSSSGREERSSSGNRPTAGDSRAKPGDEGRTEPSLAGLLGVGSVVTALDVLAVEGEEEAFEQPAYFPGGSE